MTITAQQTSSRTINGLIKQVRTTGDKFNILVQSAIVAIVRHANDFGDCTGAERLINVMPNSNRRLLVIAHFGDYSPIQVKKDGKTDTFKSSLRKPESKSFKSFDIDGVTANNWWEREGEGKGTNKGPKTIKDYFDGMEKMLERFKKEADDAEKVNPDDRDRVLAFRAHIRAAFVSFKDEATLENWAGETNPAADPATMMAEAA